MKLFHCNPLKIRVCVVISQLFKIRELKIDVNKFRFLSFRTGTLEHTAPVS